MQHLATLPRTTLPGDDGLIEGRIALVPLGAMAARGEHVPAFEVLIRQEGGTVAVICSREALLDWGHRQGEGVLQTVRRRIAACEGLRPPFAGLSMDRPHIMGIVNTTPDSFSDGGRHLDPDKAVAAGLAMLDAGATILDIGGESTRPGSDPVAPDEEIRRVLPVIRELASRGACLSIDSRRAAVMEAALQAGARIINDVTALAGDAGSMAVAVRHQAPVILMHMRGEPKTMQQQADYECASLEVYNALQQRIVACMAAGLPRENLCVDPGVGFAKTTAHNQDVTRRVAMLHGLGVPVLLGISRKTFIGAVSRNEPPAQRLPGSLAAAVLAVESGVQIVRVHDVAETAQALAVCTALRSPAWYSGRVNCPAPGLTAQVPGQAQDFQGAPGGA